jgi:S-adenosylmethionine hydrolase
MSGPVITFLSDYGTADDFVGVCHGVMAGICPDARIIDLGHGVPRHDVLAGALTLAGALPYLPRGVHLAVVDPGVGAQRRAIAVRLADGRLAVAPDNGLLSPAAEVAGGVVEAVDIASSPCRLEPVSATFHGRDIFAPVAAHLAAGMPLADTGEPVDPDGLVVLELPQPRLEPGAIAAHAVYIDHFGNVALDVTHEHLAEYGLSLGRMASITGAGGRSLHARFLRTFAEAGAGEPLLYEDAYRRLAVAISHGDAARALALAGGDELRIEPA